MRKVLIASRGQTRPLSGAMAEGGAALAIQVKGKLQILEMTIDRGIWGVDT